MINAYVQQLLETCFLYFFNIGCYDWNVVSESQIRKKSILKYNHTTNYLHPYSPITLLLFFIFIVKQNINQLNHLYYRIEFVLL
jgi:hypothetical protein